MSFSLSRSRADYDAAVTQFPTSVPASWVGADSAACQTMLTNVSGLLNALATRYDTASSKVGVIELRNSPDGSSS
ncbi:hypothetical protein [Actinomyces oris]|uniref:hypothetical protein n=1 Tax=Actinomyces oris TaxID=544580 RepID=UPI00288AE2BC|nr:hypothetical protein [Actinomyces oris]